jgi:predicted TIM-barrel fold metal-dependent hydrolase
VLGFEGLMWGSDYPHIESAWPKTREKLSELMKGIPENEAKAMIAGNAVECYGLDVSKLAPTVQRMGPQSGEIISQ